MSEFPPGFNDIIENDLERIGAGTEGMEMLKNAFRSEQPKVYKGDDLDLKCEEFLSKMNSQSITGNFRFAHDMVKLVSPGGAWNWKILVLLVDLLSTSEVSKTLKGIIVASGQTIGS